MSIRRAVPNIQANRLQESRDFFVKILGFRVAMDMDWIITFVSPTNPTAQISLISRDPSGIHPNISIEVNDVDVVHATAIENGYEIVYPLTDEPWGVRRFFVRDPNGQIVNVLGHRQ